MRHAVVAQALRGAKVMPEASGALAPQLQISAHIIM